VGCSGEHYNDYRKRNDDDCRCRVNAVHELRNVVVAF
jgi:hypothetical protein